MLAPRINTLSANGPARDNAGDLARIKGYPYLPAHEFAGEFLANNEGQLLSGLYARMLAESRSRCR